MAAAAHGFRASSLCTAPDRTAARSRPAAVRCHLAAGPCRSTRTAQSVARARSPTRYCRWCRRLCMGRAALGRPAAPSGAAVWMRRSCLPAREGLRFGWQNPKEWRGNRIDSRTLILGRKATAPARNTLENWGKALFIALQCRRAVLPLAGIFPEKMSSPQIALGARWRTLWKPSRR
jgi:hypothetical protein